MNFSKEGFSFSQTQQSTTNRGTSLNPHAAEFIPFALRAAPGNTSNPDTVPESLVSGSLGKKVLGRSESSISTNSDEEARQFWQCQLPDDITPDFKIMREEDSEVVEGVRSLSLSGMSLHDSEANRLSAAVASGYIVNEQPDLAHHHANGNNFVDSMRYPISSGREDSSAPNFFHMPAKSWENQVVNSGRLFGTGSFEENISHGYPNDMVGDNAILENSDMNPLDFLALQFPGFAADSLAEVYFTNGCDLHLTIDMLTQLELQVDGGYNLNLNSKPVPAPNLTATDFPALPAQEHKNSLPKYGGDDLEQIMNSHRSQDKDNMILLKSSSSLPSRGSVDFASAVRKLASQDSSMWKYGRIGSVDAGAGSSRSSHVLASSLSSGPARSVYGQLQSRVPSRATPVWLETGEAVASLYTEVRGEARDHARLRNAYFEQARQAYLIGNKALAKELSAKGQLHNMQMKAAHSKAQESIYRQRNSGPVSAEIPGTRRGQERMIDLHGLHVTEAIHILKYELAALRNSARSSEQRLQVYICVGTGHHTRGSRTPARLPVAVQRYLLEEESLEYTEPQPGLLRVVLY